MIAASPLARLRNNAPLERLRQLAEQGISPTITQLLPEHAALVDHLVAEFGTLASARDAAGLRGIRPPPSRESTISAMRALRDLGVPMTPAGLRRVGEDYVVRAAYALFGSWNAARTAAGIDMPRREVEHVWTAAKVLDTLRSAARGSYDVTIKQLPYSARRAAVRLFGSITAALAAAGLQRATGKRRWSRETTLAALEERVRAGLPITRAALRAEGRHDLTNAISRYLDRAGAASLREIAAAAMRRRRGSKRRRVARQRT